LVDVRELEIFYDSANPVNNRMKAATYGRGLWQSDLYSVFSVTPVNQNVASLTGSTTFSVTALSSTSWMVSSDAPWCQVTPNGTGNGTILANYSGNPGITPRVANITATPSGGLLPQIVSVTQAGAPAMLNVIPPNQNVACLAGTTNFTVLCNTDWYAVSNEPWCTVTDSGAGDGTIVTDFTENTSLNQRIAAITVTVTGLLPVTVTVTQAGAEPTLTVSPPNRNVLPISGATDFAVTSNTIWSASSDSSWCDVTSGGTGDGIIIASYSANPYYFTRVATVTVAVAGLAPQLVTVTQAPSVVSVDEQNSMGICLFPNPTTGKFRIITTGNTPGMMAVAVMDFTGKTVSEQSCTGNNDCIFDFSMLPPGVYFVKIETGGQILIKKLIMFSGHVH
jgi:hypothetical protein